MHRVCVPNATGTSVQLTADQSRHLARVVRLGPGDALVVFDGRGREWDARVESVDRAGAVLALGSERQAVAEPPVAITLAIGLLTGDQMTDVVRDATALGVRAIAPFLSDHTAVSERRDWSGARERWERVAVSAAMQSGRAVVPEIASVDTLDVVRARRAEGLQIVCVEPARAVPGGSWPGIPPAEATLFVGPEGGWSGQEVASFASAGARFLALGPRTLRAELAPTVALATLWERWEEKADKRRTEK
jgi:16S rRNA (uracil1498-N3)-methyltransferase